MGILVPENTVKRDRTGPLTWAVVYGVDNVGAGVVNLTVFESVHMESWQPSHHRPEVDLSPGEIQ
jgi:hypothetical protein